jgi:saccharopine dehydrogenase-like NADP-dependent oxidoreductase
VYCPNFTAMERATGWSAAIVAEMMAHGRTPRGAGGVETFVPARPFVEEMRRRGLKSPNGWRFWTDDGG